MAKLSYTQFDERSSAFSVAFIDEAERFLKAEQRSQTSTHFAALSYLALATGASGRDERGIVLAAEVRNLAKRMNLFGVQPSDHLMSGFHNLPPDQIKSLAFAAWGAYAWLTSVAAILTSCLALTITAIVVSTTQVKQSSPPFSQFLEI